MYHVVEYLQTPKRFVAGAKVTVYLTGTSLKAALYADQGITPILNPVTTGSNGQFEFYINDGHYDFDFSGGKPAIQEQRINDIALISTDSGGSSGGGNVVAKTVSIDAVAAGASAAVVATWDAPFSDASYKVTCSVECPVAGGLGLRVLHIESKTASQVTVRVVNDDDTDPHAGLLHLMGAAS